MSNYSEKVAKEIAIKAMVNVLSQDEFFVRREKFGNKTVNKSVIYYNIDLFQSYASQLILEYTSKKRTYSKMRQTVNQLNILKSLGIHGTTVYTNENNSKWYAQYDLIPVEKPNVKEVSVVSFLDSEVDKMSSYYLNDDQTVKVTFDKIAATNVQMFAQLLTQI